MTIITLGFFSFLVGMVALIAYLIYTSIGSFEKLVRGEPESMTLLIIFIAMIAICWPIALIMYIHFDTKRKDDKGSS